MTTYVMRGGRLVDQSRAAPLHPVFGTGPAVISDYMPACINHASGKWFDSKAAFRAETKANGCIEIGNEKIAQKPRQRTKMDKRKRKDDIRQAVYQLRNGK